MEDKINTLEPEKLHEYRLLLQRNHDLQVPLCVSLTALRNKWIRSTVVVASSGIVPVAFRDLAVGLGFRYLCFSSLGNAHVTIKAATMNTIFFLWPKRVYTKRAGIHPTHANERRGCYIHLTSGITNHLEGTR